MRSPYGRRYRLAARKEYSEASTEIANLSRSLNVARSVSCDFPGSRLPRSFNFFVSHRQNRHGAFDEVFGTQKRACFERF